MKIHQTGILGLLVLEPKVHRDTRGFFIETWRDTWQKELALECQFIQDNHARSEAKGIVRGLHFQAPPYAQSKLVWATKGSIFDVAVDLRKNSSTYGKWFGLELSENNFLRMYIPKGFAHGYITLTDICEVQYKVDAYYNAQSEGGLLWNDTSIGIKWPLSEVVLSDKDKILPSIKNFQTPF